MLYIVAAVQHYHQQFLGAEIAALPQTVALKVDQKRGPIRVIRSRGEKHICGHPKCYENTCLARARAYTRGTFVPDLIWNKGSLFREV